METLARHTPATTAGSTPPRHHVVGIAVDAAMSDGRGILRGVLRYANSRRNWTVHEDFHAALATSDILPECDGIIIGSGDAAAIQSFKKRARLLVSCSEGCNPALAPIVCPDGEAAGHMAADHLISCQLKHFAYYGPATAYPKRFHGFQQRLAASKFPCLFPPVFPQKSDHSHYQHAVLEVVRWLHSLPKPVGIFACDDRHGRELAALCRNALIIVPDHVAILGMNNDDLLCESAWPPMSSIEVDFTRVGYMAAEQMDRLLNEEHILPAEQVIRVPPRAVVRRQSTHLLAVDDPDIASAVAYIREHACGSFGVGDLLREIPLIRRTLERRFVEKLGRTPHEEITRVRMEMAQRLLRETDEPLPRIAERCGFSAPQALNYMFRKTIGQTPAAYRRLHRATGN